MPETISAPVALPFPFLQLLLNYLQGPATGYDLTLLEAYFLPDVLRDSIESCSGSKPVEIYTTETREPVPESYPLEPHAAALGLGLVLIVLPRASEKRAATYSQAFLYLPRHQPPTLPWALESP